MISCEICKYSKKFANDTLYCKLSKHTVTGIYDFYNEYYACSGCRGTYICKPKKKLWVNVVEVLYG